MNVLTAKELDAHIAQGLFHDCYGGKTGWIGRRIFGRPPFWSVFVIGSIAGTSDTTFYHDVELPKDALAGSRV